MRIADARFPSPFPAGLEYSAPARGIWNIVHTGMLIPGAHQIFVCAQGCLRGVVLTAAEMGMSDRFSTVAVREEDVLSGDMEKLIFDGVSDIIGKLSEKPPAVLIFTSCIHHFIGCDLPLVYRHLRKKFPDIDFADCYMNPIMRKSGLNPDQTMRKQLYSLLKPRKLNPKSVSIVGNDFAMDKKSELYALLAGNGFTVREITGCKTYEEYQQMAESAFCVSYYPAAKAAGDELERRLGQKHLCIPFSFNYDEISENLKYLCETVGIRTPDFSPGIARCEAVLGKTAEELGDTPVAVDCTAFPRPLGLARLLLSHGFHVTRVYADSFSSSERADFDALQSLAPDLLLYPVSQPAMRILPRSPAEKTLAIGQKAAYFTSSNYFVNLVEGGGLYGFSGICRLAEMMSEAFREPKNARHLIQIKGLGCGCCL